MGFWGALGSVGKGLINSATSNSSEDSLGGMLRKAINKKKVQGGDGDYSKSTYSDDPSDQYKKGGMVKKTGPAKVHKGERVLTKRQAKRYNSKSPRKRV